MNSSSSVSELIDQCDVSISSSKSDDSSILSSASDFEISTFENCELPSNDSVVLSYHNLNSCQFSKMESEETQNTIDVPAENTQAGQDSILQMLGHISNQMMSTIQDLQTQLVQNELKFSSEIQRITQENERFHQDLLSNVQRNQSSSGPTLSISTAPSPSMINLGTTPANIVTPVTTTTGSLGTPSDFQNQLMMMLTETFSKLTTVMSEAKTN